MNQHILQIINSFRIKRLRYLIGRYGDDFRFGRYGSSNEEIRIGYVECQSLINILELPTTNCTLTTDHIDWIIDNDISLPLNEEGQVWFKLTWE